MKNTKRIICVLLCIIMCLALFAGCSSSGESINFIYPFSADIRSLDPQIASTADEYLVIENTFEGLIRIDDDGKIRKGVADSWEISSDKLNYTFHLKKGMKWDIKADKNDDGEFKDERLQLMGKEFNPDITANDFVFALQRAVMPETNCPLYADFSAIVGAEKIHNKKSKPIMLGVTAIDDYTLVIELEHADDSFMEALTTAPAMPCNEEFFNATKGRYGLSTKYTLYNGQFYLDQILEASYLLKKNDMYNGDSPAVASELTFKIPSNDETEKDKLEKLESGYYDAAFIRGDESEKLSKKDGIAYTPYNNTTWAFVLNPNNEIMQSKTMRKAFCQGFSRLENLDKDYLSPAENLVPSSCKIGANNAIKAMGPTIVPQNQKESVKNWQKALRLLDKTVLDISIITPKGMEPYTKKMLQGVQSGLGASLKTSNGDTITLSLKVEALSNNEFKNRIAIGDYSIALYPFEASSNSALSFLDSVASSNVCNMETINIESALEDASKEKDLNAKAKALRKAEKAAINTYCICPMLYETSYYVAANGVKNIQFHPGTGRVSFANATRAK